MSPEWVTTPLLLCIQSLLQTSIQGRVECRVRSGVCIIRLRRAAMDAQIGKFPEINGYEGNRLHNVRASESQSECADRYSKVNELLAYGYRPLEEPWKLLSAYEFHQQWRCEPLLIPTSYVRRKQTPRTTWTKEGRQLVNT